MVKKARKGNTKDAVALRRKLFVEAYLSNGHNATQAAISAGFSAKTARASGSRLLSQVDISERVVAVAEKAAFDSGLSVERWAREMACIGHLDPRELYNAQGNLIPIHELPEHVARAIASIEAIADKDGNVTRKVKTWDKNTALSNIGKHLGVFEKDNGQKAEPIRVMIQLVG